MVGTAGLLRVCVAWVLWRAGFPVPLPLLAEALLSTGWPRAGTISAHTVFSLSLLSRVG